MSFNFIFLAFSTQGLPPQVEALNARGAVHRFAPLSGTGPVFSADMDLWRAGAVVTGRFCPSVAEVRGWLANAEERDGFFVAGLCVGAFFEPPAPPTARLPLAAWAEVVQGLPAAGVMCLGYDVVDAFTGISALCSVGFGAEDVRQLERPGWRANGYGLLASAEEARAFAELAARLVVEHAPFEVMQVWGRLPRGKALP